MRTVLLGHIMLTLAVPAIGCRTNQDEDRPARADADSDVPPCAPVPSAWGKCSPGEGDTACYPQNGDLYIWNPSKGCKRQVHSSDKQFYVCLNSGMPNRLGLVFPARLVNYCFERKKTAELVEVLWANAWPNRYHALRTGWRECSMEYVTEVMSAPDCP